MDRSDAFSSQLAHGGYVVDLRLPASARRQVASAGTERASPCVVAMSRMQDPELDMVSRLFRKAGVHCVRIDADDLGDVDLVIDRGRHQIKFAGESLMPTVVWLRHFSVRAIGVPSGPVEQMLSQDAWHTIARFLIGIAPAAIGTARPDLLTQLRIATECDIAVPVTVVSSSPDGIADQLPAGPIVVKAAGHHFAEVKPGQLTGAFPVVLDKDTRHHQVAPEFPVVLQEYVEHDAELRIYYIAGELYGFVIRKRDPADLWLRPDSVEVEPAIVEPSVANATRTLAEALQLQYGAFDFLMRYGEPVFLEVNPDGDWRWAELKSGYAPVTVAVANLICELHRRLLDGSAAVPSVFDLLTFLTP